MQKPIWMRVLVALASWLVIIALIVLAYEVLRRHDNIIIVPNAAAAVNATSSNSPGKGDMPIAESTTTLPKLVNATTTFPQNPTAQQIAQNAQYVEQQAIKYGVNPSLAVCIISHESQWVGNKIGDKDGKFGTSRGWWQINTYFHPEISRAFAFSLASSTDWSLEKIAEGHVTWWSTYTLYCKSIPVLL